MAETVTFPSGESLRIVTGLPVAKDDDYWDPTGSGNPLLDTGSDQKNKRLSAHFTVRELTWTGGKSADVARIDVELVQCLERLREQVGKPINVTSGFRSWKRNKEVYAAKKQKPTFSQHCGGRGADINIAGMNGLEIGKAAIDAYGPDIGVGLGGNFAHIDVRGKAAAWNYGGAKASWVTEIKAYQQKKKEESVPAPLTESVASSTIPALDGPKVPASYKVRPSSSKPKGLERYSGDRVDAVLIDMRRRGLVSVPDEDIDTFQRVANVETSGFIQGLNTWDSAVVSIGFMQWTLRYDKLYGWIGRVPAAFQRYGIELDSSRQYVIGTEKVPAIRGAATADELRWGGWAERFYLAGLDPEIVAAEVEYARDAVIPEKLEAARRWLKPVAGGFELFERCYERSLPLRGLYVETHNHRPIVARRGLENGIARALAAKVSEPEEVLAILREEIAAAFIKRKELANAKAVIEKTKEGARF